jgi:hypothetical protein
MFSKHFRYVNYLECDVYMYGLLCSQLITWFSKNVEIDWLFDVLRPAQEYFTYMETSLLPVKGCKI